MNWTISTIKPVEKFLDARRLEERIKIKEILNLFEEFGLSLSEPYLKRIKGTRKLWEFRIKSIRLLFFVKDNQAIIVHAFFKKTRQTPKKELKLAEKRRRLIEED